MRTFISFLFILFAGCFFGQNKADIAAVTENMKQQEAAWNKGDLEGFMAHYWKHDSLKFIGSKGVTYGWQTTLDNYKKSYPNQEAMGVLTFENSTIEQLASDKIFVIGKWSLKKKDKEADVSGYYTLLWKKIKGKWVIVVDHTS